MTAQQIKEAAKLLSGTEGHRKVTWTEWISGKITLGFMNSGGKILKYEIFEDGTSKRQEV
jgi:hypothetical protein